MRASPYPVKFIPVQKTLEGLNHYSLSSHEKGQETWNRTSPRNDERNLIQEGADVWSPTRLYVQGNRIDELEVTFNVVTSQYGFHQYDARGHCILTTDISGNMMEEYDYDAWGKPHFYSGSSWWSWDLGYSEFGNRFLFTGREWLSDLGVYDYRNRLYHPELGRFLQPDPKEFGAGDYNLYRYCHNDPINSTDPTGLVDLSYTPASDTAHVWEDSFNPTDRFTIAGHANSQGIVQNNKLLTPEQVARDMIAKGFTPEKPVLLCACETGKGPDSFASKLAQTLAKLTGAETKVQAPTTKIASGSTKGAEPTVQANDKTGKPGELKTFTGLPPSKKLKKDE
jgi:RHS repeat-associated protein